MPNAPEFFVPYKNAIDSTLLSLIEQYSSKQSELAEAMRYSTLLGGKRIRPTLVLATAEAFSIPTKEALPVACAVEMIHAYSLIHDDLPAMDDDDLRRGQATCHIAFSEATAILAGDALQAMAFEILADQAHIPSDNRFKIIKLLAQASGARGMVLGQAIDLEAVGEELTLSQLEKMHSLKTGALIEASIMLGAYCSKKEPSQTNLKALSRFAKAVGLAFQVQDDILDIVSDTETLGKQQGADAALNKPTYPALLGLDGAREKLTQLREAAYQSLKETSGIQTDKLEAICDYVIQRKL